MIQVRIDRQQGAEIVRAAGYDVQQQAKVLETIHLFQLKTIPQLEQSALGAEYQIQRTRGQLLCFALRKDTC